jgi:hypothetical protein
LLLVGMCKAMAQDYFSDRNGNGTPILVKDTSGKLAKQLFSAGVDLTDKTNIKVNFYAQSKIAPTSFLGWGVSAKGTANNGATSLFSASNLSPGFGGGAYLAYTKLVESPTHYYAWAVILSANLNYTTYQFFTPSASYSKQLSSVNFSGNMVGISTFFKLHPGHDNLFLGASFSLGHQSNYNSLSTVTIKNDSTISGTGKTRTVEQVNKNGDNYATGSFLQYTDYNFRLNGTYIPGFLKYKFGLTVYPSIDLSTAYSPKYNAGLAFSFLKNNNPSTATASLFFEFDDIGNAQNSTKPFLNRSFKVGISTTLNVLTGSK